MSYTLPETNSSHLKMDGWNINLLLGPYLFSGAFAAGFRESVCDVIVFRGGIYLKSFGGIC